jgi:hypothetical protein
MTNGPSSWRRGVLARAGLLVLTVLTILSWAAATAEAAAKRRVGVSLSGMPAGPIREAVSDVLKKHGFEAATPDLSGDSEDAISSAAKAGKLSAVIVGEVREGGKRVKLRVYSSSGDLIGEGSWAEKGGPKKLAATVERTLWARVGGSLSKARPPAGGGKAEKAEPAARADEPEERAPAEETPTYSRSKDSDAEPASEDREASRSKKSSKKKREAEEEETSSSQSPSAGPALEILVGPRFVRRDLTWDQPASPANPSPLNPYSLGFAAAIGGSLAWFPVAHFSGGWASNLGLAFAAEYIPGVTSQTTDGSKYPTSASDYTGGVRGRVAFGPVRAAITLGGGQQAVIFRSGGTTSPRSNLTGTPDVKYTYARFGADLRIALPANLNLTVGGAYRYVLSAGDQNYLLETPMFLPAAKVSGFDVGASVGYQIFSLLEARLGFDMRQYKITPGMNTHMVEGGTDRFIALWGAVVLTFDGATGGSSADAESKPAAKKKAAKADEDDSAEE